MYGVLSHAALVNMGRASGHPDLEYKECVGTAERRFTHRPSASREVATLAEQVAAARFTRNLLASAIAAVLAAQSFSSMPVYARSAMPLSNCTRHGPSQQYLGSNRIQRLLSAAHTAP